MRCIHVWVFSKDRRVTTCAECKVHRTNIEADLNSHKLTIASNMTVLLSSRLS